MKTAPKKLKYPQMIALIDALRSKVEDFTKRKITNAEAAAELSKHCGFEITEGNLIGAKNALNVHWVARNQANRPGRLMNPTYIVLARAILELETAYGVTLTNRNALLAIVAKDQNESGK